MVVVVVVIVVVVVVVVVVTTQSGLSFKRFMQSLSVKISDLLILVLKGQNVIFEYRKKMHYLAPSAY